MADVVKVKLVALGKTKNNEDFFMLSKSIDQEGWLLNVVAFVGAIPMKDAKKGDILDVPVSVDKKLRWA